METKVSKKEKLVQKLKRHELVGQLLKQRDLGDLRQNIGEFVDCDLAIEQGLHGNYDWIIPIRPNWCTDDMLRKRCCHYKVFRIISENETLMSLREYVFYESINTIRLSPNTRLKLEYKICTEDDEEDDAWFTYMEYPVGTKYGSSIDEITDKRQPLDTDDIHVYYAFIIEYDETFEDVPDMEVENEPINASCFQKPIYKVTLPHPVYDLNDYTLAQYHRIRVRKGETSYCIFDMRIFIPPIATFRLCAEALYNEEGTVVLQPKITLPPVTTPLFGNIWLIVHTVHKMSTQLKKMHETMKDELGHAEHGWYADLRFFQPDSKFIAQASTKNYGGNGLYRTDWVFRGLQYYNQTLLLQELIPSIPLKDIQIIFHRRT